MMGFGDSAKKLFSGDEQAASVPMNKVKPNANIIVRTPEAFNDVQEYADGLIAGNILMINLEDLGGAERNRIFDYMNGVAYIVGANIDLIGDQLLIYCPEGVTLDKKETDEEE